MAFRVGGKVERLYVTAGRAFIRLTALPASDTPKDGYFQLSQDHPNYDALYSLALTAAVNRLELQIRITGDDIDPNEVAHVQYMVVDW